MASLMNPPSLTVHVVTGWVEIKEADTFNPETIPTPLDLLKRMRVSMGDGSRFITSLLQAIHRACTQSRQRQQQCT
ncbi:hypothetical protein RRG08_043939 [Elysia crispata]|uniref:Uncharacterized protein n=1 Tax=Elysia crispata TaxID=231223 RepID=A0AAE0Y1A0_9GAST|nr:hypothetical protein RRG08_043939 [Elysia crispata]